MDNNTFWKLLDQYSWRKDKDTFKAQKDIAELIKRGYEQRLDVLAAVFQTDKDKMNQAYIGEKDQRLLVCYTSREMAVKGSRKYHSDSASFPVYVMINNLFNKKSILGIVFNPTDEERIMLVMRPFLETAMPGPKPKPEGFREAN